MDRRWEGDVWGPNVSRRGVLLGGLVLTGAIGGLIRPQEAWAAGPGVKAPPIIGCDAWRAREPSDVVPVWEQRPVRIIVHHTATPNVEDYSRGAGEFVARKIQDFHMDRRGWIDTGQNFTISRGGYVLEGRHGSLEVLRSGDRHVEGAHCTGQNVEAVGIENEGTYSTLTPPDKVWARLRAMCAYICQQYGIAPTEIGGHRDFKDTLCPGDRFYAMLPRLRTEVADSLGEPLDDRAARRASWPLLRPESSGPAVEAAQHLLRAAGLVDVQPNSRFDERTAVAVRQYQQAHRAEEVNGLIGGETWPLLVTAQGGDQDEVALAVRALTPDGAVRASAIPGVEEWKRLLSAADHRP
ncbi:N-acetylmuramoyl-L-alanine amidase [Pseudonocardia sp. DSM 110487]|uniref:peptidoglycan recognition protein family protein n=1 Tax=Pseudonocardia sp. DSM 110487 TaxID=2865833 RepID=UPI001C69CE9E|nr:N-acetylmuramoyl-L-alanine amidase [Pseudonocardia sp. DSM 110487]QYN35704.1 N-acetylmuramoyl-L-alanine amidase [Pseudonocardia sp. DSM 110487]